MYQIDYPYYEFRYTCITSRRKLKGILPNHQLQTVAAYCGYDLTNHHHALADAEACTAIARYQTKHRAAYPQPTLSPDAQADGQYSSSLKQTAPSETA